MDASSLGFSSLLVEGDLAAACSWITCEMRGLWELESHSSDS